MQKNFVIDLEMLDGNLYAKDAGASTFSELEETSTVKLCLTGHAALDPDGETPFSIIIDMSPIYEQLPEGYFISSSDTVNGLTRFLIEEEASDDDGGIS